MRLPKPIPITLLAVFAAASAFAQEAETDQAPGSCLSQGDQTEAVYLQLMQSGNTDALNDFCKKNGERAHEVVAEAKKKTTAECKQAWSDENSGTFRKKVFPLWAVKKFQRAPGDAHSIWDAGCDNDRKVADMENEAQRIYQEDNTQLANKVLADLTPSGPNDPSTGAPQLSGADVQKAAADVKDYYDAQLKSNFTDGMTQFLALQSNDVIGISGQVSQAQDAIKKAMSGQAAAVEKSRKGPDPDVAAKAGAKVDNAAAGFKGDQAGGRFDVGGTHTGDVGGTDGRPAAPPPGGAVGAGALTPGAPGGPPAPGGPAAPGQPPAPTPGTGAYKVTTDLTPDQKALNAALQQKYNDDWSQTKTGQTLQARLADMEANQHTVRPPIVLQSLPDPKTAAEYDMQDNKITVNANLIRKAYGADYPQIKGMNDAQLTSFMAKTPDLQTRLANDTQGVMLHECWHYNQNGEAPLYGKAGVPRGDYVEGEFAAREAEFANFRERAIKDPTLLQPTSNPFLKSESLDAALYNVDRDRWRESTHQLYQGFFGSNLKAIDTSAAADQKQIDVLQGKTSLTPAQQKQLADLQSGEATLQNARSYYAKRQADQDASEGPDASRDYLAAYSKANAKGSPAVTLVTASTAINGAPADWSNSQSGTHACQALDTSLHGYTPTGKSPDMRCNPKISTAMTSCALFPEEYGINCPPAIAATR